MCSIKINAQYYIFNLIFCIFEAKLILILKKTSMKKLFTYDFDYSSNKLLKQSWQSDTTRKNNRFINT